MHDNDTMRTMTNPSLSRTPLLWLMLVMMLMGALHWAKTASTANSFLAAETATAHMRNPLALLEKSNFAQKDTPGASVAAKGAGVADKLGDAAKAADELADAAKTLDKLEDAAKAADELEDVAKTLDKLEDAAKVLDNAGDAAQAVQYWEELLSRIAQIDSKLVGKAQELIAEIKSLPELTGKTVGEVRKMLHDLGYTVVRSDPELGVGVVWTKNLGNGFTSVVRADKGSGKVGMADEFLHFHKEGVPSSFVNKGNFKPDAPVFKFDDLGNKSFPTNWPGNHIQAKMP